MIRIVKRTMVWYLTVSSSGMKYPLYPFVTRMIILPKKWTSWETVRFLISFLWWLWLTFAFGQSKWVMSGLFAGVILWRHDAEAVWITMGSVINTVLSVALKRIINQERPASALKSDPGMPSSHAQSIFFIVTVSILSGNFPCSHCLLCTLFTSFM